PPSQLPAVPRPGPDGGPAGPRDHRGHPDGRRAAVAAIERLPSLGAAGSGPSGRDLSTAGLLTTAAGRGLRAVAGTAAVRLPGTDPGAERGRGEGLRGRRSQTRAGLSVAQPPGGPVSATAADWS